MNACPKCGATRDEVAAERDALAARITALEANQCDGAPAVWFIDYGPIGFLAYAEENEASYQSRISGRPVEPLYRKIQR